ncbi:MAG: T9SS type A sorting domain-containing protein [Bacteroidetes bacterium]|nr:T9SS type A sorting domain-containing protein [Bacteroidota bacterium]
MNYFLRKILCAISLLLLQFSSASSAQQTTLSPLSPESVNTYSYGFNDTLFYKMDSTGSTIWSWNFSEPFVVSPDYHRINGYTLSGDRIIVMGLQGSPFGMPGDYFLATFVFDTLGNLLDSHVVWFYNTSVRYVTLFANAEKGAWIVCSFGNTYDTTHCCLLKTDSLGLIDPAFLSPSYVLPGYGNYFNCSSMPDSGYIMVFSSVNMGMNESFTLLSRISKDGYLLWTKSILNTDTTANLIIYNSVTACDSMGSVYLISACDSATPTGYYKRFYASKIDSSGNIITDHKWIFFPPDIAYFTQMYFLGNQLQAQAWFSPGYVYYSLDFDSSFNNTCMGPDFHGDFIFQTTQLGTFSVNRIPVNLSQNPIPYSGPLQFSVQHSNGDYCALYTTLDEIPTEETLQVWPNPASEVICVKANKPDQEIKTLQLYSMDGKSVIVPCLKFSEEWKLDVSHLNNGLYLLKAKSGKEIFYNRLLILH